MADAYIYDHVRTPRGRGRADGSLHPVTPTNLLAQTLGGLRERSDLDTSLVEEVVVGCVTPVGEQGGNLARIGLLVAEYDEGVPGKQLNRYCASGLESVNTAAALIMSGQADVTIGGGVESMSRVAMGADGSGWASDPQIAYKLYFAPQGIGADLIATKYGFSRDDVDAYAVESQRRAKAAWDNHWFDKSVMPVRDGIGQVLLDHDEHMRPETTMQTLASLKPSFAAMGEAAGYDSVALQKYPEVEYIDHVHHAGNSSGIVDGAASVLLGSKKAGKALGLKPRARIRSFASIGSEPTIMLTGPADAARKALKVAGMEVGDIDLHEMNEAFASAVLRYLQALDVPHDIMNVAGGAIAMGHPLGATGAMIIGVALDELERRDLNTALVSLCVGAGMGTATIIERV